MPLSLETNTKFWWQRPTFDSPASPTQRAAPDIIAALFGAGPQVTTTAVVSLELSDPL